MQADIIIDAIEKKFLKNLTPPLAAYRTIPVDGILEEIARKMPLLFDANRTLGRDEADSFHLRIASMMLSSFSSLQLYIRDRNELVSLITRAFETSVPLVPIQLVYFSLGNAKLDPKKGIEKFPIIGKNTLDMAFGSSFVIETSFDGTTYAIRFVETLYRKLFVDKKVPELSVVPWAFFEKCAQEINRKRKLAISVTISADEAQPNCIVTVRNA